MAAPNSVTATSHDVLRDEQLAEYIRSALLVLKQNWSQVEMVNAEGGGITQWMKVAHLAEAYNLPVVTRLTTEILGHTLAPSAL